MAMVDVPCLAHHKLPEARDSCLAVGAAAGKSCTVGEHGCANEDLGAATEWLPFSAELVIRHKRPARKHPESSGLLGPF